MATHTKSMQELWQDSYLTSGSEEYIEELYEQYLQNPQDVAPEWRQYFDDLAAQNVRITPDVSHAAIREQFLQMARNPMRALSASAMESGYDQRQERVIELIAAYRRLGHLQAQIDPLNFRQPIYSPTLELAYYGFNDADLKKDFNTGSFTSLNQSTASLQQIHEGLRRVYCGSIGFEYMHINRSEEVEWIRDRIEQGWANFKPSDAEKLHILDRLVAADGLEKYLGFKYVGQKRFSLEGGDSLIPMMDAIVNRSVEQGVKEVIIGMAHRGRLNVLANIVGKDPKNIFSAFEGTAVNAIYSGDVKYHLGCSSNVATKNGNVHIALAFNPSHLEIVSPVVQGSVRARQRRRRDADQRQVVPIQLHGDAAFAGQGVVMETFNMSQARWFMVGGSVHIVINNQVGFTISNPKDSRSTIYCTDIAKMVEAPILHVNANDPEAAYFAALFAIDYRHKFKRDVVIDLVCYRRHGHNEADEPSATQPVMYKVIKAMEVPYKIYAKKLQEQGLIKDDVAQTMADAYRSALDSGQRVVKVNDDKAYDFAVSWAPFEKQLLNEKVVTAVPSEKIKAIARSMETLPEGFVVQPQVNKMLEAKKKMTDGDLAINWGYAEAMAYATLLDEGYPIRLCGQDAGRGTFAHRHAVLHDQNNDDLYIPLSHVSPTQAQINIVDSLLSEEAVLAFEYGYATAEPNFLVIWEAQFGDFANGAQVVMDQFISSGEQKWMRFCGLVMLLPHGYEGQGPEHSSARLERYLQLCAQDNMQVCIPTTPAQIFHLMRRQMLQPARKPLVIMSPKSLLRNPLAVSDISELSDGHFQRIIPETDKLDVKKVTSIVFCTGKVYYDLLEERRAKSLNNCAIVRVEQLYPFPAQECESIFATYPNATDIVWCQEEPENQGAWPTLSLDVARFLKSGQALRYAGRKSSASPAVGYHAIHEQEQKDLVTKALMK
jgi:2-oxoglutarate dehydrogenase E1 component